MKRFANGKRWFLRNLFTHKLMGTLNTPRVLNVLNAKRWRWQYNPPFLGIARLRFMWCNASLMHDGRCNGRLWEAEEFLRPEKEKNPRMVTFCFWNLGDTKWPVKRDFHGWENGQTAAPRMRSPRTKSTWLDMFAHKRDTSRLFWGACCFWKIPLFDSVEASGTQGQS